MCCFLQNHERNYSLSFEDLLDSVSRGLSGASYAARHWELSETSPTPLAWGHRGIAILEYIPVLGALAALLERVAFFVYDNFFNTEYFSQDLPFLQGRVRLFNRKQQGSSWQPRALSIETAMKKMWKNSKKTLDEHLTKHPCSSYASLEDALPSLESFLAPKIFSPLNFSYVVAEAQGPRARMEDAHFFKEIDEGAVLAVFDGHGGKEVSQFASHTFQYKFPEFMLKAQGNVRYAFETTIHEIHRKVAQNPEWDHIGSTAVICFVNKHTHQIYTATLGDSEANIYRKNSEGQLKSVPLSCVRDWSSVKDALRAAIALNRPVIAEKWPKMKNPKSLRYPKKRSGINVSRAIGDFGLTGTFERPAVIHKPKITVNRLKPGDTLILACDGLKDFVFENEIVDQLDLPNSDKNMAQQLVDYALNEKNALDNVTALVVNVS